jgi:hypothetical protein
MSPLTITFKNKCLRHLPADENDYNLAFSAQSVLRIIRSSFFILSINYSFPNMKLVWMGTWARLVLPASLFKSQLKVWNYRVVRLYSLLVIHTTQPTAGLLLPYNVHLFTSIYPFAFAIAIFYLLIQQYKNSMEIIILTSDYIVVAFATVTLSYLIIPPIQVKRSPCRESADMRSPSPLVIVIWTSSIYFWNSKSEVFYKKNCFNFIFMV